MTNATTHFDPGVHPRDGDGKFAAKRHTESPTLTLGQPPEPTPQRNHDLLRGLPGYAEVTIETEDGGEPRRAMVRGTPATNGASRRRLTMLDTGTETFVEESPGDGLTVTRVVVDPSTLPACRICGISHVQADLGGGPCGDHDPDLADQWREHMMEPDEAQPWIEAGWRPEDSVGWDNDGFTPHEADEWAAGGLDNESASVLRDRGLTPNDQESAHAIR